MYNNITSQIIANGKLTEKVQIERSVRQGCPLSMILFVLTTIPLINMIEENPDIKGIRTKYKNEIKILAYADDTTICISDSKSIPKTIEIYNKHAAASESKLNNDKTEILKLGKWKTKMPMEENYKNWIKEEINVLGGRFSSNKVKTGKINWELKIEKIRKLIQSFETRNLSMVGKVLLANTILLSQIWHIAAILPMEEKYILKINRMINIWINGKNGEYIIDLLAKKRENGGLGLINLENRIKTIKIKSLQFLITGKWTKEHEILIYWAGTHTFTLGNKNIIGPRCENGTNDYCKTMKLMVKHKEKLREIDKMKLKDIEKEIYRTEQYKPEYANIYSGKYTKFISINFKIATGILKTATKMDLRNRACIFCKERAENIYHLFF